MIRPTRYGLPEGHVDAVSEDFDPIEFVLIAALSDNHVIGWGNDLPWRIPADLKHFKATTLDHVMVMGSNTWRSFGSKPLPKRRHVVITSRPEAFGIDEKDRDVVTLASDLKTALASARIHARANGQNQIFVIGGANVYEQMIDLADRMILTRVEGVHKGDKFFPKISPEWTGVAREIDGSIIQESNGYRYSIWDYVRTPEKVEPEVPDTNYYFCDVAEGDIDEIVAWGAEKGVEVTIYNQIFEVPHPLTKHYPPRFGIGIVQVAGWTVKGNLELAKEFADRFGHIGVWESFGTLVHERAK